MRMRRALCAGVGLAMSISLAACGGGSSSSTSSNPSSGSSGGSGTPKSGGVLKVVSGSYADSLDPDFGYTTQQSQADNMVYTPLLTYAYKEGTAGTALQPGLAEALPTVSSDGLTYTLKLRSGLTYSDGTPVKASDFAYAIMRSIKISWGGSSFFTGYIKGAADYADKKATAISGIKTDDATGDITITLTSAYGAFSNILAFPAAAPIPSTTPMKVLSANPPVGIGPYKFSKIVLNASYTLVKNPSFAGFKIPNIPTGYVDEIVNTTQSNSSTESEQILNNTADIFDPSDEVDAKTLASIPSQAKDRFLNTPLASTYYFFMNTKVAPFNNLAARQAVNMAIDRTALSRLSSGALTPGCFFLPPTIVGHNEGSCVGGDPTQVPSDATIAKAKSMISAAGLAGSPVTVWTQTKTPRLQYDEYYENLLNQLGFKATLKTIQNTVYFQTIGNQSLNAQTGFADWSQDFPNPSDFYLLLSKAGIQATNNENFGNVDDPKIESQLATLAPIPAGQLSSKAADWQALDKYVDQQAYTATFGYSIAPKFMSNKVDFATAVFNPVNYIEYSTVSFK